MKIKKYFGLVIIFFILNLNTLPLFAADDTLFNTVNLQAQAEREIENDQMIVLLATEFEGAETASLAAKINADMKWALERIEKYASVESQTKNYQTSPTYRKQVIISWRASQQIEIKSENIAELTELVGKLQERLQVKQMSFSPTTENIVKFENELIEEAMQAFLARVEIVKKHMPVKNHRIISLHINTGGYRPPVVYAQRNLMKTMEMASAPAVESGTSNVSVIVSGSVQYY